MKELREVEEMQEQIKQLDDAIHNLKKKVIEENCPVKIGDVVEVTGYSNNGKMMEIHSIELCNYGWKETHYEYKIKGKVIKKDGTVGKNNGENRIKVVEE